MSENVRKLVGVAAMAALVVVGVVATSGGDDVDFTRNAAYIKYDGFRQLPEAEQARLAPVFLEQAAPKSLDTGPINKINKEGGPIGKGAKASILSTGGVHALSTGKASVLKGKGVDGKGGTSSIRLGGGMDGKTGKAGIGSTGGVNGLSGRKASFRAGNGVDGVADRIEKCTSSFEEIKVTYVAWAGSGTVANSLKNVLVSSYSGEDTRVASGYNCQDLQGNNLVRIPIDPSHPKLLAECMESKVGEVFLKSHIDASAANCVATVIPALSPDRAKRLGTYWQTPEQLICAVPSMLQKQQQTICESLANVDLQN